jgi:hypothetical protein
VPEVVLIVAEWLPFGANNIKVLAQKVGADERVSSGFYSASIDQNPSGTSLDVEPGLTNITIVDIIEGQHVNLEAEIYFPEEEGIVQVENFGVHLDVTGTCFCGVRPPTREESRLTVSADGRCGWKRSKSGSGTTSPWITSPGSSWMCCRTLRACSTPSSPPGNAP